MDYILVSPILILRLYALHNMPKTEAFTPDIIGGII